MAAQERDPGSGSNCARCRGRRRGDGGGARAGARAAGARVEAAKRDGSPGERSGIGEEPQRARSHRARGWVQAGGDGGTGLRGGRGRLLYKGIGRGKVPEIWQMAGYRKRGLVRLTRGGSAAAYDGVM